MLINESLRADHLLLSMDPVGNIFWTFFPARCVRHPTHFPLLGRNPLLHYFVPHDSKLSPIFLKLVSDLFQIFP